MFSIASLLDGARSRANLPSDNKLADALGISRAAVSSYRHGKSYPDDRVLGQLCALAGQDVAVWAAEIQSARAQSDEGRAMWLMVAKRLQGAASTAILSVLFTITLIAGYAEPARSASVNDDKNGNSISYTSYEVAILSVVDFLMVRLRRWQAQFAGLFRLSLLLQ